MKRAFLTSAAAAALMLSLTAANAQDMRERNAPAGAPQQLAPQSQGRSETPRQTAPREQSRDGMDAGERASTTPSRSTTTGAATRDEQSQPSASKARASKSEAAKSQSDRDSAAQTARSNNASRSNPSDSSFDQNRRSERNASEQRRDRDRAKSSDRERSASERSSNRLRERNARDEHARDRGRDRTTTGNAATENRNASRATESQNSNRSTARTNERNERSAASLSGEQRSRVTERFASRIDRMNVRPISRSRISVHVGATIPRSIELFAVPDDVIAIYPRFRGDRFVLVEDEIVVVEPSSRHIVAVLPREGGSHSASRDVRETTGSAVGGERSRLRLSETDRHQIRTVILRDPACRYEARLDFTFGIPLPSSVKVCEFPEAVVSEVPEVEHYRYVVRDDNIVVVDPAEEDRVVEVIR